MNNMAETDDEPVSRRRPGRSYSEYLEQQRQWFSNDKQALIPGGRKLWKEMMIGFSVAVCLGMVMLILGLKYFPEAIRSRHAIQVLLCVLGIVCGLIIVISTVILGKLSISQKWRHQTNSQSQESPGCCVTEESNQRSPSEPFEDDQPPPYCLVVREIRGDRQINCVANNAISCDGNETRNPVTTLPPYSGAVSSPFNTGGVAVTYPILSLPNYSEAVAPLPPYPAN